MTTKEEPRPQVKNLLVRYGVAVIERGAGTPMREEIDHFAEALELYMAKRERMARIDEVKPLAEGTMRPITAYHWAKSRLAELEEEKGSDSE